MSASYPPPQQQPAPGQNPYAAPPSAYGQQAPSAPGGQAPWGGAPQQPGFDPAAYPPPVPQSFAPAPAQGNAAMAVLAAVAAMVVAALLYGLLIKGTKHEIGYAALGVGAVIGLALGKIGGRNPVLPFVGLPLALLGVYLGQIFGIALLAASANDVSVTTALTDHYGFIQDAWKESMDAKDILFFGIAGLEGFLLTKRVAG